MSKYYDGDECLLRMGMLCTNEEIIGFLKCNVYKYVYRCTKKHDSFEGACEDLRKASSYSAMLQELTGDDMYGCVVDEVARALSNPHAAWCHIVNLRCFLLNDMEHHWRWNR